MIEITGAAENNLKKLSLRIPKEQLVVLTGVSGQHRHRGGAPPGGHHPGGLDHRHRPCRRRPGRSGALYGNARPADSVPRLRNRPFSPESRRRTAPGLSHLPNPEYPHIGAHRYRCNLQKSSAASSPFRAKAGAFSQKNTLHADGMQSIRDRR